MKNLSRRRWVQWVGITAMTFALAEVALRSYNALWPSWVFFRPTYDQFRRQPGLLLYGYPVNSGGFKDREPLKVMPHGWTRAVALGDSFAFGVVPYPDLFLTLLERELPCTEVVNMGIPNADTGDYALLLQREGLSLRPDLVVAHFFVGNDFETRRKHTRATERSYVWQLFRAGLALKDVSAPSGQREHYDDSAPTMLEERFDEIAIRKLRLFDRSRSYAMNRLEGVRRNIEEMRDLALAAGADFAVVLLPDEPQVDPRTRAEVLQKGGFEPARFDFLKPNALLSAVLAQERIPYLDLTPRFQEVGPSKRLYKPRDTHFNLAGNRLAADTLAPFLAPWTSGDCRASELVDREQR